MRSISDVVHEIKVRISRARKFRFEIGDKPGAHSLMGNYWLRPDTNHCTVLEAVLLGQPSTGNMVQDAANSLGTTKEVVEAFLLGIQGNHEEIMTNAPASAFQLGANDDYFEAVNAGSEIGREVASWA